MTWPQRPENVQIGNFNAYKNQNNNIKGARQLLMETDPR